MTASGLLLRCSPDDLAVGQHHLGHLARAVLLVPAGVRGVVLPAKERFSSGTAGDSHRSHRSPAARKTRVGRGAGLPVPVPDLGRSRLPGDGAGGDLAGSALLNPLAHPAFASLGLRPLLVPMVNVMPWRARLAGAGHRLGLDSWPVPGGRVGVAWKAVFGRDSGNPMGSCGQLTTTACGQP